MQKQDLKVAVVGAGVIGLSAAYRLANELPGALLTVVADKFFEEDIASCGAAGLWEPYKLSETPLHLINRWGKETFRFLRLWTQQHDDPQWRSIVPHFHRLSQNELAPFKRTAGSDIVDGWSFTTIICEGATHVAWLHHLLQQEGVLFQKRTISSLKDLKEFDVVINCTGLGSHKLLNDSQMTPIRGHVLRVHAPWIKNVYFKDESTYIIPNRDTVVLGGTGQIGDWDTAPREDDRKQILHRCSKIIPSVRKAEFVREWVGLRPGRNSVRLELEHLPVDDTGRRLPVVHNYGHGGAGLTLAWGCAGHVVEIVANLLQSQHSESKL